MFAFDLFLTWYKADMGTKGAPSTTGAWCVLGGAWNVVVPQAVLIHRRGAAPSFGLQLSRKRGRSGMTPFDWETGETLRMVTNKFVGKTKCTVAHNLYI